MALHAEARAPRIDPRRLLIHGGGVALHLVWYFTSFNSITAECDLAFIFGHQRGLRT